MINEQYVSDLEKRVELLETRLLNYNFFLLKNIMVTEDPCNGIKSTLEEKKYYVELLGNGEEKISFFIDGPTHLLISSYSILYLMDIIKTLLGIDVIIEHGKLQAIDVMFRKFFSLPDSLKIRTLTKFNGLKEIRVHGR